ncbi:MAG: ester cyclase [Caldilineaceae bacterium]
MEDQVAEEDKVVTRFTISGRQEGEFAGIPPAGKFARVTAMGIHRVVDGQIDGNWLNWDALGLMQQLGAIRHVPILAECEALLSSHLMGLYWQYKLSPSLVWVLKI